MSRIAPHLLIQDVDGDVVIIDESSGAEIIVPRAYVGNAATAFTYFFTGTSPLGFDGRDADDG